MAVAENELLDRARNGEIPAFEQLLRLYEKKVFNLTFRLTGNRHDAEDLAQEAFLKVFRSLDSFRGESSFSTWLYRITRNTCLDWLRRRKVSTVSLDDSLETPDGSMPRQLQSKTPGPDEILEQKEALSRIQAAISSLPEEYRLAAVLRDVMGFTYEETAEIMECSLGTVKSRIHRARGELRGKLRALELFPTQGVSKSEGGSSHGG